MWSRLFRGLSGSHGTSSGETGALRRDATTPPPRRGWALLPPFDPPLRRAMPLASGVSRFSADLVARHQEMRYLAPLGHDVTVQAPRGIAIGIARAAATTPRTGPSSDRPLVQRGRLDRPNAGRRWRLPWPAPSPPTPAPSRQADPARAAAAHTPDLLPPPGPPVPKTPSPVVGSATLLATPATIARIAEQPTDPRPAAVGTDEPDPRPTSTPFPVDTVAHATTPAGADTPEAPVGPVRPSSPPRTLAAHPARVLRPREAANPPTSPSAPARRPADLPLRSLAVHRSAEPRVAGPRSGTTPAPAPTPPTDPAPDSAPATSAPTAGGARCEDLGPTPPTDPPVVQRSAGAESATQPRPTVGQRNDGHLADRRSRPIQRRTAGQPDPATARPVRPAASRPLAPPGVGSPLASLPPTARTLRSPWEPEIADPSGHETVTGASPAAPHDAALARGDRWPQARTTGPAASPSDRSAPPAATHGPPVVARRLDATVVAPPPRRDVRTVLPLAGLRAPLIDGRVPPVGEGHAPGLPEPSRAAGPPAPVRWVVPAATARPPASPNVATPVGEPLLRATDTSARPAPHAPTPAATPYRPSENSGGSDLPQEGRSRLSASFDGHPLVERLLASRSSGTTEGPVSPRHDSAGGGGSPPTLSLATPVMRDSEAPTPTPPLAVSRAVPAPASVPPQILQRDPEPAAAAAPPMSPTGEPDGEENNEVALDRIFHELYPRVRDELRWELRVQRERVGLLSDPL